MCVVDSDSVGNKDDLVTYYIFIRCIDDKG